jgi:transcriptional regulator with XRE-family HTH domain
MKEMDDFSNDFLKSFLPKKAEQEKIDYRMKLASKIYDGMKNKGWNQTRFAEEMSKKVSVISRWLSGTHNFETDTLFDIQQKLGISLLDIQKEEKSNSITITADSKDAMVNVFLFPQSGSFNLKELAKEALTASNGGVYHIQEVAGEYAGVN